MSWVTIEKFYCDRCKKEGTHHNTLGVTWFGFWNKREVCTDCYKEFEDWFFNRKPKEAHHD